MSPTYKSPSVLKTDNLSIGYFSKKKSIEIASHIDIDLQQGELVGLIGANGIGKSTLLRTLCKVQTPLDGDIFIKKKSLQNYSDSGLSKVVSLVLTDSLMSKNLSVFELVALGRHPYTNWIGHLRQADYTAITHALNLVDSIDLKEKKCFELSDGQLQKVMIARALAQDTDIIVLDEPTAHLDIYHKIYIIKRLQKLAKDTQKTILFSSHEIDLTIQLCDKLIVMTSQKVIADTPKKLIEQGTFNSLFPKDLITFDERTRRFQIQK